MAIYQGDIGIHDIKVGSIDVFEIYQGNKLVYPENTEVTITFKLNVSGNVTINGYTSVISENILNLYLLFLSRLIILLILLLNIINLKLLVVTVVTYL